MEEHHQFVIGERIRVLARTSEGFARTGIISYLHNVENDPSTVFIDVIYDNEKRGSESEEENNIPIQFVQAVLPFEHESKKILVGKYDSTTLKEFGNQLFHLKDYKKAMELYELALQSLASPPKGKCMSLGTSVIVFIEEYSDYLFGIISSNDDFDQESTYEVMLCNEEERIFHEKDLIEIPSSYDQQLLLRSLYSNLGKCAIKRQLRGWSVRYGCLTLVITRAMINLLQETGQYDSDPERRKKLQQLLIDALFFRSKAFLAASRPQRAMIDCKELSTLDNKKAKTLEAELMAFKIKRQKDNRKLAKEIAKWVDQSLNHSSKVGGRDSANVETEDDIPLMEDDDDEEHPRKQTAELPITMKNPRRDNQIIDIGNRKDSSANPSIQLFIVCLIPPFLGYLLFRYYYSQ